MYQALYRKWRPQTFSDVSGQPHVTKTLAHELETGRLSHAYLFTGSRGTGKTSCAKILAKAVNCLAPVNGNPCNECEICRGIDSGSVLDVIEIDAASNNGVDNIRDLREEANFTPVKAKYRVYIIDEVHMLSIGAFNALLKILEEPPAHVIFILATTEVHKLPATILSRCQRFDFKHISPEDIVGRLKYVAEREQLSLDDDAAALISRIADGALRDALSLLDRCSASGERITAEAVSASTGLTGRDYLYSLADCIREGNTADALGMLDSLHTGSCNMEVLCSELIEHFRNLMIAKTARNAQQLIICAQSEFDKIKNQSSGFTLEKILYVLSLLESSLANIKRGLNKRLETEMAIIRLCTPRLDESTQALLARIAELEKKLAGKILTDVSATEQDASAKKVSEQKVSIQSIQVINTAETNTQEKVKSDFDAGSFDIPLPDSPPPLPDDNYSEQNVLGGQNSFSQTHQNSSVAAPFKNEDTPVKSAENAVLPSFESDNKLVPFNSWQDVLEALFVFNKAFSSILKASKAYIDGSTVYIESSNTVLPMMMTNSAYLTDLQKAAQQATGSSFGFKILSSEDFKIKDNLNDTLSSFMKKANSFNSFSD